MRARTQVQLMLDFISKAMFPRQGGLDDWASLIHVTAVGIRIAACDRPDEARTVDWQVVARGAWRVGGGQVMERPAGVTEEMAAQLTRAMGDMDANELTPATASKVIQVGLYGEVRYP